MHESLAAGRPVEVTEEPTLADSLGGGIGLGNRWTFPIVRDAGRRDRPGLRAEIIAACARSSGGRLGGGGRRLRSDRCAARGQAQRSTGPRPWSSPAAMSIWASSSPSRRPAGDTRRSRSGDSGMRRHLRPHRDASCAPACSSTGPRSTSWSRPSARLASGKVVMPPILSMDDPRRARRGRREDRLHAGLRRLRDQGQPRLLRQSQARPAQPQRPDDPVLGQDRPGRGGAAGQRLPHRRAHRRGRRGRRAAPGAARGADGGRARRRRAGAAADPGRCIWCAVLQGAGLGPRPRQGRSRARATSPRRSASRPSRPTIPPPWCATASWWSPRRPAREP